jgi:hypothetical protein
MAIRLCWRLHTQKHHIRHSYTAFKVGGKHQIWLSGRPVIVNNIRILTSPPADGECTVTCDSDQAVKAQLVSKGNVSRIPPANQGFGFVDHVDLYGWIEQGKNGGIWSS